MKQISKNKLEFECIVRSVQRCLTGDPEEDNKIDCYINYFDTEDEINLLIRGNYEAEHIKYLQECEKNMKLLKIVVEVKDNVRL